MQWLQDNIYWIKDVATVLFTALAVLIAFFTYRRARHTVLAPVRTEVIKRQLDLISELLTLLKESNYSLDKMLDYKQSAETSLALQLMELGLDNRETESGLQSGSPKMEDGYSWFVNLKGRSAPHTAFRMDEALHPEHLESNVACWDQKEYVIYSVYTTEKFYDMLKRLEGFRDHPMMPPRIQKVLSKVIGDVEDNIYEMLPDFLHSHMEEVVPLVRKEGRMEFLGYSKCSGTFDRVRKRHQEESKALTAAIRKFLHVETELR